MSLGDKLSKLRKENNYTQEQLADVLGVSRQAISKWESDLTYPETDKLVRISRLFHCTTDYLLLDEQEEVGYGEQNRPEQHVLPSNRIFIESPLTKNLVSCLKVTASPVMAPTKQQPKYLLLGVDNVTALGEHTTQLGWYETEEAIQKEISQITAAIREGKNCYTLQYNVAVDVKALSVVMKKVKLQDESGLYQFGSRLRERKSEKSVWGMPLWHIGRNARGFVAVGFNARGVIAIGLKAKGIVALGVVSLGLLSIGTLSLGLLSLGVFALGIASAGCFSFGALTAGSISFGLVSLGSVAIGDFSLGALAVGKYFAQGDQARAMIAIGEKKALGSLFQKTGALTAQDIATVKRLLDSIVPAYLSWAKEIIKLFLH